MARPARRLPIGGPSSSRRCMPPGKAWSGFVCGVVPCLAWVSKASCFVHQGLGRRRLEMGSAVAIAELARLEDFFRSMPRPGQLPPSRASLTHGRCCSSSKATQVPCRGLEVSRILRTPPQLDRTPVSAPQGARASPL